MKSSKAALAFHAYELDYGRRLRVDIPPDMPSTYIFTDTAFLIYSVDVMDKINIVTGLFGGSIEVKKDECDLSNNLSAVYKIPQHIALSKLKDLRYKINLIVIELSI